MPRTVEEGFRDFLPWLTPSTAESEAASSHRASIESCIKNNFGLNRFFRTGSFGNGTSISGHSDVDYFASIPREQLTNDSGYTLSKVRNALDVRFPNTGVRVNCPAVRIPFGTQASESTELVPADYIETQSGYKIYDIPDCAGSWRRASPDAHNAYVARQDDRLNGKVKPLIRFIKAWKFFREVPISSFYLELRVAKYCEAEKAIVYSIDIKNILTNLLNGELAQMQDPMGVSGYIAACATQAKYEDAMSKLDTAATRATKARDAEAGGNIKLAFDYWSLLFNGFPSYYY